MSGATNHTFAGVEHSRLCDCKHPLRPHGHESTCLHYRPLRDWTDEELASAREGSAARVRLAHRAHGRAKAKHDRAAKHHRATLEAANAAWRTLDDLATLDRAIAREALRRAVAPRVVMSDQSFPGMGGDSR
jgi:hypothetical protein